MWTFYKLTKLEAVFEDDIFDINRLDGAYEIDEGFEVRFSPDGVVPRKTLRVVPVLESGKARLRFEVLDEEETTKRWLGSST